MAAMAPIDFGKLFENIPKGAWVALSSDQKRVITFGADMREVLEEARKRGEQNPIIARVPEAEGALLL